MQKKVLRKQKIAEGCFICCDKNQIGLQMSFYEVEGGEVVGLFCAKNEHTGYPDRLHGGVIAAIIDETMGRAVETLYPRLFGVTTELTIRYKKPVPAGVRLKSVGRIDADFSRTYECSGEILGENGEALVTAKATFFKMNAARFAANAHDFRLHDCPSDDDPEFIEI